MTWDWKARGERVAGAEQALREARRARRGRAALVAEALQAWRQALAMAWPPAWDEALRRLRAGDAGGAGIVVEFLEAGPRFFRSGYAAEQAIRCLKKAPLDWRQRSRLEPVLLDAVDRRHGREFRAYCQLARMLDSPGLRQALAERSASAEPAVRRHAAWMMAALEGKRPRQARSAVTVARRPR